MRRRGGFTMVELMVAVGLGGVLAGMLASFFHLAGRPARIAQARQTNLDAARAVFERLRRDVARAAEVPTIFDADGQEADAGPTVLVPVLDAAAEVRYEARADGVYRKEGDGPWRLVRAGAAVGLRFSRLVAGGAGDEQVRLAVEAQAGADLAMTREGAGGVLERDDRADVRLELELPAYAMAKTRGYGSWNDPRP